MWEEGETRKRTDRHTEWCEGDLVRGENLCESRETSEMIGRRIVKFESVVFFSLFISFVTQARA